MYTLEQYKYVLPKNIALKDINEPARYYLYVLPKILKQCRQVQHEIHFYKQCEGKQLHLDPAEEDNDSC